MKTTREGAKMVCKNGLKCGSQEYSCLKPSKTPEIRAFPRAFLWGNSDIESSHDVGKCPHAWV